MKNILGLLIITFVLAGTSTSHAYQYWICLDRDLKWSSNTVNVSASSVSFADANWQNALSTMINLWNQNPSQFRFTRTFGDTSIGRGNGQNEVWFSNDASALDGAPAIAYYWYDCIDYWIFGKDVELTEFDVLFDAGVAYTPFMSNKNSLYEYGGGNRPFQTTAIHEFGHGLGLAHTNYTYNVMGQDWTHINVNSSTARGYVGEDTSNGAVHLYGLNAANIQDLSVTHWKYAGASGEYSTHTRTRLYSSADAVLPSAIDAGEPRYNVSRGQTVKLELTYENSGKNTQSVSVGYFISTNSLITTADTRIGTGGVTLSRDGVFTTKTTLVIPNTLVSGQKYWIGAIIDDNNAVAEITESNNATYIPIKVN